jgi:DNA-binding transcriptional ArsR family regulator
VSTQIVREPRDRQFDVAVTTFKLLADKTRLRIIWALLHGEHSVNELAAQLSLNPAGVSQHLAKLRLAHLVSVRRDGTRAHYCIDSSHVGDLVEQALFHADHVASDDVVDESTHRPSAG